MTKNITKQICYISSGEFTVTLTGNGVGGRNQEMLLGFLIEECKTMIENPEKYNEFGENYRYTFTSCAFDGLEAIARQWAQLLTQPRWEESAIC